MSIGWSDLTPEGRKYFAKLEKLKNLEVTVGFQEATPHGEGSDATIPEIAAYNEFGTSKAPSRPFMKQSFENHEKELKAACDEVNNQLSNGGTAEKALNELGVFLKGLVQSEIVDGEFAPNSPATIAKKGSETPLIDTGLMRQSVNYQIKEKED